MNAQHRRVSRGRRPESCASLGQPGPRALAVSALAFENPALPYGPFPVLRMPYAPRPDPPPLRPASGRPPGPSGGRLSSQLVRLSGSGRPARGRSCCAGGSAGGSGGHGLPQQRALRRILLRLLLGRRRGCAAEHALGGAGAGLCPGGFGHEGGLRRWRSRPPSGRAAGGVRFNPLPLCRRRRGAGRLGKLRRCGRGAPAR